jgi:hypothetical protein
MWMHPDQLLGYVGDRTAKLQAEAEQDRLAEQANKASRVPNPRPERTRSEARPTRWPTWLLAPLRLP